MVVRLFAAALLFIYPVTACAVDLPAAEHAEQAAVGAGVASEQRLSGQGPNLTLNPEAVDTLRLAAVEPRNEETGVEKAAERTTVARSEAQKKESCNFWEIHFGGYRWIWWAGAAVALIGIHVAAD